MKIAYACVFAACFTLLACGSTTASTGSTADVGESDVKFNFDSAGTDATTADAGSDTAATGTDATDSADTVIPSGDPLVNLGSCVGTAQPMTISVLMAYATIGIGPSSEAKGAFVLDFSSTFSSFDLAAFSPAPTTTGCDTTVLGSSCTVPDFHVFGAVYKAALVLEDFSGLAGPLRQAGIIGTDFLSLHVISLSFSGSQIYASPPTGVFCTDAALQQQGLVALSTSGYYQHDLTLLHPYTIVDSAATPGGHVPNVPTVPIHIAGVAALAQLDTGFSDALVSHSVNINKAFLAALQQANPNALVRDATLDTKLSTCVAGLQEPAEAYHLASGQQFELLAADGSVARAWADATIFVKQTPAAAHNCGGIGTWAVPAAQVGASFYGTMGTIIFDPFAAKVWIPKK